MKKIEAIIRTLKLDNVHQALHDIGIKGMTTATVMGMGQQKGYIEMYRGNEVNVNFLSKTKLEIIVEDELVDDCIQVLMESARTGELGDGKIIITSIDKVIRIRTGEQGRDAM